MPTRSLPVIFVFGSNLAGNHWTGSARWALLHAGAVAGQGEGLQGSSYAIPTRDRHSQVLPLARIAEHVERFVAFARAHPELRFHITLIGGLTGYKAESIAAMFVGAPSNCELPALFVRMGGRRVRHKERHESTGPDQGDHRSDIPKEGPAPIGPLPTRAARRSNKVIFVFESNLTGRHETGAALWAVRHAGAIYGEGEGLQGSSYAIPTRNGELRGLPLAQIGEHVERFLAFARAHPELRFKVAPIGGLAGYQPTSIAPMFVAAPSNCDIPMPFAQILRRRAHRTPQLLKKPISSK